MLRVTTHSNGNTSAPSVQFKICFLNQCYSSISQSNMLSDFWCQLSLPAYPISTLSSSLFPCINPSSLADTTSSPDISTRFKFDLDTRPCAQFLASILDLDFLTKNLTTKNRYANCQRTLLFLSGHSIKVEPKNQCRIGISGFETNLLPQDLKFGPVTEKAFVLEVGLQTNHII